MMLKKAVNPRYVKRFINAKITNFKATPFFLTSEQTKEYQSSPLMSVKYFFSTQKTPYRQKPVPQNVITLMIQSAKTTQELHKIIDFYHTKLNFIHRTVLLQRATQRPFDKDEELVSRIIKEIKSRWSSDFQVLSESNSRAVANIICYMSRKTKFHDLDQEFSRIDFYELVSHLQSPKEFVMMINGILKLQLLDKVIEKRVHFKFQEFLSQTIDQNFTPSLLVSMWFNVIKYKKSSQTINDFFAQFLKNKHFKSNLIDYMQIIYCYVNSEGKRSIDLSYPIMTHPKDVSTKNGYLGAHELSVLYEELGNLKKIKDVYFSDEFNMLLESCFIRILTEQDIPLRNVANVFVNLTSWQNPTSKMLDKVYHKYYTVLKNELKLIESQQPNKKFRPNVDPLSFVTLFELLIQYYHAQNQYLKEMTEISLSYVQTIMDRKIISDYNQKTFVRLLSVIELAKNKMHQRNPQDKLVLHNNLKVKFAEQISKRNFNEVVSLGKMIGFVYNMEIREKETCKKFKNMIKTIPQKNQHYVTYQEKLKQSCILDKNCSYCLNCFS